MPQTTIAPTCSDDDIAAATALAWEFIALLRDRYPERIEQIETYLIAQRFEEMLADFRAHFCPPVGECMLARLHGAPVGIVMLKPMEKAACEMNRMFVQASARGHGIGRALCLALFERARDLGYTEMRLGALDRHVEALPLYRSLGFVVDKRQMKQVGVIKMRRAI